MTGAVDRDHFDLVRVLDHVIVRHHMTVCGDDETRSGSLEFVFHTASTGHARTILEEAPVEVTER